MSTGLTFGQYMNNAGLGLLVFLILSPLFLEILRRRFKPGTRVQFRDTNKNVRFGTVHAYPRYSMLWGAPGLLVKADDGALMELRQKEVRKLKTRVA